MGILQARILEWVAIPSSRGSSQPGMEPRSPALQADSLPSEPPGNPKNTGVGSLSLLQGIFPTWVSCIAGRFFTSWATREAPLHNLVIGYLRISLPLVSNSWRQGLCLFECSCLTQIFLSHRNPTHFCWSNESCLLPLSPSCPTAYPSSSPIHIKIFLECIDFSPSLPLCFKPSSSISWTYVTAFQLPKLL